MPISHSPNCMGTDRAYCHAVTPQRPILSWFCTIILISYNDPEKGMKTEGFFFFFWLNKCVIKISQKMSDRHKT